MLHTATDAPQRFEPNARIIKTVVESYYSRGVAAADRARDRAERGYTIAGAAAAALVGAGLLANLSQRPAPVQLLALAAVNVWLVAVMLFVWTVAVDVSRPDAEGLGSAGWTTGCDFVRSVSRDVQRELDALHARELVALTASVIALVLTSSAFVAGTLESVRASREQARIALGAPANSALGRICGGGLGDVYATVDPADLSTDFVSLVLPPGECGDSALTIREPRTAILTETRIGRLPDFQVAR